VGLHHRPERDDGGRRSARKGGWRPARRKPRRRSFLVRKDGHVFTFVYPPEHERAALLALADCPKLEPEDVLALVCYLGHDPRELGLDKLA
jgi:hypothetical protein